MRESLSTPREPTIWYQVEVTLNGSLRLRCNGQLDAVVKSLVSTLDSLPPTHPSDFFAIKFEKLS